MSELSLTAQAVLDAVAKAMECPDDFLPYELELMAAALRAAADQVVPKELPASGGMRPGGTRALTLDEAQRFQRFVTRKKLFAIAIELENHQ